ncbi:hypothetical protein LYNGBM3L_43080 [Moorena producens 3L]|uniref:Uncharacterized protein n=1 Tax=Moorena producens 3L TaxID=489825 RepID=F4XWB8_9CYAN|nr:hypothetical protein LYNGBM3L_43080 [Moorena producens 3L]
MARAKLLIKSWFLSSAILSHQGELSSSTQGGYIKSLVTRARGARELPKQGSFQSRGDSEFRSFGVGSRK